MAQSPVSRTIVHLNVADFAAAVERLADPVLSDRPLVIAPEGASRARVFDMSEAAYQAGVRKGMLLERARRICRDAVVIPPRPDRYERAMTALSREVLPYSPLVEAGAADGHLFVDLTGTSRLLGPGRDTARRMYRRIRDRLGLCPIWAAAPNKLVSKVATRLVKPLGEYVVEPGGEAGLLSPLPVDLLPGIDASERIRLQELNLFYVRQVAALNIEQLGIPFGSRAGLVYNMVRGIDPSPVLPAGTGALKVSAYREFAGDTNEDEAVKKALYRLVETIGSGLRRRGKAAGSLVMVLDYADGQRCFRQLSVRPPSANDFFLFPVARSLLEKAWRRRVRLRRLCLVCIKPVAPDTQMALFRQDQTGEKQREAAIHAVDSIRERFGGGAIRMGRALAS
ncbi:MAG: hypothetical protein R6X08_11470 [Desulfosalsimonadaceae bacterium]